MARISLDELFDEQQIELLGNVYVLRGATKSRLQRLERVQPLLADDSDAKPEQRVKAAIELVDIFLEPVDGAPPAGKVLSDRWRQDQLELQHLDAIAAKVSELIEQRANPTSERASGD